MDTHYHPNKQTSTTAQPAGHHGNVEGCTEHTVSPSDSSAGLCAAQLRAGWSGRTGPLPGPFLSALLHCRHQPLQLS